MRHHSIKLIALLSMTILPLGTAACSKGSSSPTEPALLDDDAVVATSTSSASLVTEESKGRGRGRGSDDNGNDDNGRNNRGGKGGKGGKGGRGGNGGQDDTPRAGREFEGTVTSVGQGSLTLAGGTRIIVNGQTQWVARGDLHTLNQVSRAVDAGRPTRAEGRGNRQADGSIVALTLKVEVDD